MHIKKQQEIHRTYNVNVCARAEILGISPCVILITSLSKLRMAKIRCIVNVKWLIIPIPTATINILVDTIIRKKFGMASGLRTFANTMYYSFGELLYYMRIRSP